MSGLLARLRARRSGSLASRSFVIIAIAVLIPSLFVAGFGVYAFYAGWERSAVLASDQSRYESQMYVEEVASLANVPEGLTARELSALTLAIGAAHAFGLHEAYLSTVDDLERSSTLPEWAIRSLRQNGYAYGDVKAWSLVLAGEAAGRVPPVIAWRDGGTTVRYFNFYEPTVGLAVFTGPALPMGRLVVVALLVALIIVAVGLLSAYAISHGVVRPVRRVAEASRRVADGVGGDPVRPEGPRELQELALAFNDMKEKLAKAQEAEQSFLLSVSHELKTPLTSIRGYAEGVGDGAVQPADGAVVIAAEAGRLERLVGDLLDSARMRKSAFTVRRESVDLDAVARDVAARYAATADEHGLTLATQLGAEGQVLADHDRLVQVVSNLVENAIRCTPGPGMVSIATTPQGITVSDTGPGLTSDDMPRAFERFYLYSRYGGNRVVGTGLGLSIVKELSEAMGGHVTVSSAVGVGTAFTVALIPAPPGNVPGHEAT